MPAITTIRVRRATAAQWTAKNPVLAAGEMGYETDTYRFKFGDGLNQWTSLYYQPFGVSGMSIYCLSTGLQLAGDVASPGNRQLYGTGAAGAKGWFGQPHLVVPIMATADASTTWTDMPAAATMFLGSYRIVRHVDLTNYSLVRMSVLMGSTAAKAGATMGLKYRTTFSTAYADYTEIAATGSLSVPIATTATFQDSGWVAMAAGAKADVYLCPYGVGGDGTIDPIFAGAMIEFKVV